MRMTHRKTSIARLAIQGQTYGHVGSLYKLSPERVRQIVNQVLSACYTFTDKSAMSANVISYCDISLARHDANYWLNAITNLEKEINE